MSTSSTPTSMPGLKRQHVVWLSLAASMTAMGGLLLALDGSSSVPSEAFALASTVTNEPERGMESIFETNKSIDQHRWKGIVIHHSGSQMGSPESITRGHEAAGLRGLGYHFVITNGQGAPDGSIHVGYRWQDQLPGAHTAGPDSEKYNRETIGICLVGDGDRRPFTEAQLNQLVELIVSLQRECGLTDEAILLNRDVSPTSGPGRLFPEAALFRRLSAADDVR